MEGSGCGESGQNSNIPQNPWLNVDRVDWGIFERQRKKKTGEDGSGDAEGEGEEDQVGVGRVREGEMGVGGES